MIKIGTVFGIFLGLLGGVSPLAAQAGPRKGRTRVVILGHASRDRSRTWSIYQDGIHRIHANSAEYFTVPLGRTLVVRELGFSFSGRAGKVVPVELVLKQGPRDLTLARATFRNRGDLVPFSFSKTFTPGIPVPPGGQVKVADPGPGTGEVFLYGFLTD